MCFSDLVPSRNLQIFRYQDIDHFRQGLRGASVDFIPLANADVPLGQAVLSLPGCDLYLLHTFPRIVHAMYGNPGAFVMLSMRDSPAVIINGREVDRSTLRLAQGPVEYRAIEREPGYYAALAFSPMIEHRGWPETDGEFLTVPISADIRLRLRRMILCLFAVASRKPDIVAMAGVGAGLVDSLLDLLDQAFDGYLSVRSPGKEATQDSLRVLRSIDDLIDSNSLRPIYSEDIASELGVSVRTLTSLMVRTNGMSLHRYIRLRRLWKVRRQLLSGDPRRQIKEIALTNGFWHLGDFAAKYFSQFGELPSSTQSLAQLRQ
jgi:AraC-like DNA-binding protein